MKNEIQTKLKKIFTKEKITGFLLNNKFIRLIKQSPLYIVWYLNYFLMTVSVFDLFVRNIFMSVIYSILVYTVSIIIAFVFGDKIICLIEGIRPLETKQEIEYLTPIFEDVFADAQSLYTRLSNVKLYIIDDYTVNAYAIGSHTIAVTQGAVETFSEDELKAIMAHELSHIYHGDSVANIINRIGNGIFSAVIIVIQFILRLIDNLQDPNSSNVMQRTLKFIFVIIQAIFGIFIYLFSLIGNVLLSINRKHNEYTADKFAFNIGHGEELKNALYLLQKISLGDKMKLVERLKSTHPRISSRIGRLEEMLDNNIIYS